MKIALIGASGFIGSALREEALQRNHQVTALVSRPERLAPVANLTVGKTDALDSKALAQQLRGYDAVLSAFSGHADNDIYGYYMKGFHAILAAVKAADTPRFLLVGGAASLEVAPGKLLFDTPEFPDAYKATAKGAMEALALLRQEPDLDWTVLSPAAELFSGKRTGQFRLGADQLLSDDQGHSRILVQDYAVAMIDELETPRHSRRRFSVSY